MMREEQRGAPDLGLALMTLMLLMSGLMLIYSSSAILALGRFGDCFFYIKRQLLFAVLGVLVLFWVMRQDRQMMRDYTGMMMIGVLVLLTVTLVPHIGKVAGGARRWLGFGPFRFQPSELAKIALVLFSADRLSKPNPGRFDWSAGLMPVLLAGGACAALTLLEPDFGSSVMIVLILAGMFYCSGIDAKLFVLPFIAGVPAAAFMILHSPYRMRRVEVFLDPWKDPDGAGFQIVHSLMAFGTGGLQGQGLGQGKQKLYYLPEPHTDFIFSTAGEELGLWGCLCLLALFALFLWRGFIIALKSKDSFRKLASVGITLMLGLQVIVNLFVVLGLAPTKGTTLPFLSFGGSALMVDLAAVGLLLNFSIQGP